MGVCKSSANQIYKKVAKKPDNDDPELRHMDVSTIFLSSMNSTIIGHDIHYDQSLGSIISKDEVMTLFQNDEKQMINLYVLGVQSTLSDQYRDTEHSSFAVIPNKINSLIYSYYF